MILEDISTVLTVMKGSQRVKNKNLKPFSKKIFWLIKLKYF